MEQLRDKTIKCKDCGKEFVFTVRDQEFYKKMNFDKEPSRCKDCRDSRKRNNNRR